MNDLVGGSTLGSKVNEEIIAMDEGTSSRKRCTSQEVQVKTLTGASYIHFITEGATLDGPESSNNTISGPSQFELVACNLGKPYDLTPLSNAEKRLAVMPTTPIFAQPVLRAPAIPSTFSVTIIASKQHRKAALGIRERIQRKILGTSFE
ncbi:hypothetical protein ACH5RR_036920 [Cinchona calisaya]|uniref:Uncharacterized protein n=1 Tax=Cinchona calisaya TaxID=153742 RepID=A0ABD2Y615_9GENT